MCLLHLALTHTLDPSCHVLETPVQPKVSGHRLKGLGYGWHYIGTVTWPTVFWKKKKKYIISNIRQQRRLTASFYLEVCYSQTYFRLGLVQVLRLSRTNSNTCLHLQHQWRHICISLIMLQFCDAFALCNKYLSYHRKKNRKNQPILLYGSVCM